MKNIFKFMSMALVASALMVACGDKDDENTDTTPTPEPPTIAEGFNVTFDGNAWTPTTQNIRASEQYQAMLIMGYTGDNQMPMVDMMTYQYGVSEGSGTASEQGYTGDNDAIYSLDYYDQGALFSVDSETGETSYYGDWWIKEGTFSVTAFDATNLTMTATCNATMFDATACFVNQTATVATAPTKALTFTLGNVEFEAI